MDAGWDRRAGESIKTDENYQKPWTQCSRIIVVSIASSIINLRLKSLLKAKNLQLKHTSHINLMARSISLAVQVFRVSSVSSLSGFASTCPSSIRSSLGAKAAPAQGRGKEPPA